MIKLAVNYNDGLTTFLRRFSNRKEAQHLTITLQEQGFEARLHDRTYGATGMKRPVAELLRIDPKQRYEILVKPEDFGRAYSAMITAIAEAARVSA